MSGGPIRFTSQAVRTVRVILLAGVIGIFASLSGCISAVGVGISLVGRVVDDADVKDHAKVLLGEDISAADERFGERIDVNREVNGSRAWHIYPVKKLNFLGKDRYVVEVENNKIVAITRAEKTSDPKMDVPRALIIAASVDGKSPTECEEELDLGKPLLTARSDSTGLLSQTYDARIIEELGRPNYCVLRFDENEKCKTVEFLGVGASTKENPI
ncbi:MAG: hypothetical protein DHS20C16_28260 [Phycisphaerae bacterium]|nr:MAG: hypothetical protein DHS20C16_28260 [Phycisphaerae bacterium]